MKAGGRVRVGSFGFGVAESSLENAPPVTNLAAVEQGTNLTAVQQEASLTLDLAHLLRATGVSSGVLSRLLPTLSVTRSDKHSRCRPKRCYPRRHYQQLWRTNDLGNW